MRVENLENAKGNVVKNQFVITDGNRVVFQSYESMIAEVDRDNKTVTLGRNWNYSQTTRKYRNIFFDVYVNMPTLSTTKGIEDALKNGLCNGWKIAVKG